MAKKRHLDEFNPWPAFVDLFASVIMVVLMFMLILIVNLAFYAQFKFKVSYTGQVAVDELIVPQDLQEQVIEQDEVAVEIEDIETKEDIPDETREIQSAGVDLTRTDHNATRQENIIHLDWMVIQYMESEIILDPPSIADVEEFIGTAKEQFGDHYVSIFTSEPKGQTSATIARQIGLSRALNVRNLIRKLDYHRDDVVVRLREDVPTDKKVDNRAGYVVITINEKR